MNASGRRGYPLPSPLGPFARRRRTSVPSEWPRLPPDFVGVGAQRSGTTWWYGLLTTHPGIHAGRKELHYFDPYFARDLEDGDVAEYHRLCARPGGMLAGEWTPRYMADFWTPARLRRAAPNAKVLILLRDPIDRFNSGLSHELDRFVQSVPRRRRQYAAALSAAAALSRSLYGWQIRNVLHEFPREQVLILQYEECVRNPEAQLRRTFQFLGADPVDHVPDAVRRPAGKTRAKVELPAGVVESALQAIRADARDLAEIAPELDLGLWSSASPTVV